MENKYKLILEEVSDEIESALNDSRGIEIHQRRLAFSVSLGASTLIESYLHNKGVLKSGSKINHQWFNKNLKNLKETISDQVISSLDKIKNIDNLLEIVQKIESKRNEIIYGKSVAEKTLNNLINLFFELKKEVQND